MQIYVYTKQPRDAGFNAFLRALKATRLSHFDGLQFYQGPRPLELPPGSVLVYWGTYGPPLPRIVTLNGLQQLEVSPSGLGPCVMSPLMLYKAKQGLRPTTSPAFRIRRGLEEVYSPDFHTWIRSVPMHEEYILHVFQRRVFLAGVKTPVLPRASSTKEWVAGETAHPYYKSRLTGWKIAYGERSSERYERHYAIEAIAQGQLLFGAVNLYRTTQGRGRQLHVRSINTGPTLTPKHALMYAKRITRYLDARYDELYAQSHS